MGLRSLALLYESLAWLQARVHSLAELKRTRELAHIAVQHTTAMHALGAEQMKAWLSRLHQQEQRSALRRWVRAQQEQRHAELRGVLASTERSLKQTMKATGRASQACGVDSPACCA